MATNIELRRINQNNVYKSILKNYDISKQQLARNLGLSIPTTSKILDDLVDLGLVKYDGFYRSTGGRKAQRVLAITKARIAIGVDVTPNHVTIAAVDLAGNILKIQRERIRFEDTTEYYQLIGENISNIVNEIMLTSKSEVLGVSVAIPGIVSADGKEVRYAILLNQTMNIYSELKKVIPYPLCITNDANASAYSELYSRKKEGKNDSFTYLMLSNSVGGAIVVNGEIVKGQGVRSGEFGHAILVPNGRLCYCGHRGHVDGYLSALLLSDRLEDFFEQLRLGDKRCQKKWEEYLKYLVMEVYNLQVQFDLEVVIGGYVGWYVKPYLQEVCEGVKKITTFTQMPISVSAGSYNFEAAAMGGALYYIDQFVSEV